MADFIGGIGLFLLGMALLTEGLKAAAGHAAQRALQAWAGTPLRGVVAGALVTALLQASGAVTVAAIGFVNAGVLTFRQAMWIVFGSNLGTTLTAWVVAAVGLDLDVEGFALPLIGVGMLLTTAWPRARRGAAGQVLAGFGVLFLGLEAMAGAFEGVLDDGALAPISGGAWSTLTAFAVGMIGTVLVQSSSATIALAITAAAGGALPLGDGAAMVIGANVGTTSTAVFASLGASVPARRLAGAHVLFNVITGALALLALPVLLGATRWVLAEVHHAGDTAVALALFHTGFNLLGIGMMFPLGAPIADFLEHQIADADGATRPLDRSVLAVPDLAVQALRSEVDALADGVRASAAASLDPGSEERPSLGGRARELVAFAAQIQRGQLQEELVHRVLAAVEAVHRLRAVLVDLEAASGLRASLPRALPDGEPVLAAFREALAPGLSAAERQARAGEVERRFREARTALVNRSVRGELEPEAASAAVTWLGLLRRVARGLSEVPTSAPAA